MVTNLDTNLRTFRSKTKIRGGTDHASKLKLVRARWSKCAEDCLHSGDTSEYREQFGRTHQALVDIIDQWDETALTDTVIITRLTYLRDSYLAGLRMAIEDYDKHRGVIDAMYYLVAEIEAVIELRQPVYE